MLSNFLRKILSLLSFWSLNDLNSIKSRDKKILKIIEKKLNNINFNKKYLKNTHNLFNKKILDLLKKRELTNFLRKNFIQKMFFVHNRLFILRELYAKNQIVCVLHTLDAVSMDNEVKSNKEWILNEFRNTLASRIKLNIFEHGKNDLLSDKVLKILSS